MSAATIIHVSHTCRARPDMDLFKPVFSAPSNYVKPEVIEAYLEKEERRWAAEAANQVLTGGISRWYLSHAHTGWIGTGSRALLKVIEGILHSAGAIYQGRSPYEVDTDIGHLAAKVVLVGLGAVKALKLATWDAFQQDGRLPGWELMHPSCTQGEFRVVEPMDLLKLSISADQLSLLLSSKPLGLGAGEDADCMAMLTLAEQAAMLAFAPDRWDEPESAPKICYTTDSIGLRTERFVEYNPV